MSSDDGVMDLNLFARLVEQKRSLWEAHGIEVEFQNGPPRTSPPLGFHAQVGQPLFSSSSGLAARPTFPLRLGTTTIRLWSSTTRSRPRSAFSDASTT